MIDTSLAGAHASPTNSVISSVRIGEFVVSLRYHHLSEDRLANMIDVIAKSRAGQPYERRLTPDEATAYTFRDPDFDAKATWLVDLDGEAVAYGCAIVEKNRLEAGRDDGRIDIDVVLEHRGMGIEEQLLDKSIDYMRSRKVGKALARCPIVDEWKSSLLTAHSFKESYRVYVLAMGREDEVPPPETPSGFSLVRKEFSDYSDEEIVPLVEAFNASFVDHHNFAPEPPERFVNFRDGVSDPMMWTVAMKGDAIAGVCLSEESSAFNKERGVKTGWINILGVRPEFRRRGLARAMLSDGIRWILGRGMETVYIGVLAKNDKALDLYRSVGFEKEQESIWFERSLKPAGSDGSVV